MKNSKYYILLLFFLCFTFETYGLSFSKDSTIRLIVEAGGGYGVSTDTLTKADGSRYGLSGTFRLMIKTDNLLRFGLETGWLHIASFKPQKIVNEFGESPVVATLKALPIMLVFNMNLNNWYTNTGLGYYYVQSSISAFNESVSESSWNIGFYLSIGYRYKINNRLDLTPELKWNSIGELGKTLLSAQICLSFSLLEF